MQKKLTIASHLMCWNTEYIPRRSETRAACLLSTTSIQHCSECEWEIRLTDSYVWTLSPQLGMLFGEVMEPFGDRASLEEVHHYGCAMRAHPLPVPAICFLYTDEMWSLYFLLLLPCFPHYYELYPSGAIS